MSAWCPQDYSCQFTQVHPRVVTHWIGLWYNGTWGVIVALVAIVAIACLLAYVVTLVSDSHSSTEQRLEREKQRQHELALEEQRTMQADSAKGDPEMLKLIRQRI